MLGAQSLEAGCSTGAAVDRLAAAGLMPRKTARRKHAAKHRLPDSGKEGVHQHGVAVHFASVAQEHGLAAGSPGVGILQEDAPEYIAPNAASALQPLGVVGLKAALGYVDSLALALEDDRREAMGEAARAEKPAGSMLYASMLESVSVAALLKGK
eukprot:SAG31_NODE_8597_length_1423_cov_1.140483_2_plen_155_part_00